MMVRSVRLPPAVTREGWPFDIPAVAALIGGGVTFKRPITFLLGENGSGKSTIIEAIAEAYGLDVRGGHAGRRYSSELDRGALGQVLEVRLALEVPQSRRRHKGFFLRAETAMGMLEFMSSAGVPGYADNLAQVSHGESFLSVLEGRFVDVGLYLLDEPETPLSFLSTLRLMVYLSQLADAGAQVICATHSPLLSSLPGAEIIELNETGLHRRKWDELQLVRDWRAFIREPDLYLRHLFSSED